MKKPPKPGMLRTSATGSSGCWGGSKPTLSSGADVGWVVSEQALKRTVPATRLTNRTVRWRIETSYGTSERRGLLLCAAELAGGSGGGRGHTLQCGRWHSVAPERASMHTASCGTQVGLGKRAVVDAANGEPKSEQLVEIGAS